MNKIRLGVNIDHVATIRNARGEKFPDVVNAALICEKRGADSITIHLREDRRHIRDYDLNFKKLWLSKKAADEVNFIRKTKCFCTHECFNSVNIMFNPKFYPKIIKKSKLV